MYSKCTDNESMMSFFLLEDDQKVLIYEKARKVFYGTVDVIINEIEFKVISKRYPSTTGTNELEESKVYDYSELWNMYLLSIFGEEYRLKLEELRNQLKRLIEQRDNKLKAIEYRYDSILSGDNKGKGPRKYVSRRWY